MKIAVVIIGIIHLWGVIHGPKIEPTNLQTNCHQGTQYIPHMNLKTEPRDTEENLYIM